MLRTLRKAGISMLAVFTAVSMLVTTPFIKISAADGGGSIVAEKDGDKVVIGNDYISREFSTAGNKLVTTAITNKRTSGTPLVLVPGEGSEEFIIKRTKNGSEGGAGAITLPALNRNGWTAIADSYHNASGPSDGPASNLLDGNNSSIWHSAYDGGGQTADETYPHAVNIKMNSAVTFKSFSYTPRQEGEGTNGNVKGYKLYAANSSSQLDWTIDGNGNPTASGWTLVAEGNFKYNGVNPIYVNVKEETTANQLIFVATSSNNGAKFAGGAEFNLHADAVETPKDERSLLSSEFTLNNVEITDTNATINDQEKVGKKVTFSFDPIEFNGVTYTVKENVVMYEGDHFMRKFLEISVPESQALAAEIDYIDLESLVIDKDYAQWTIPTDAGGIVEMSQFKANLGQPFYVQGMFMGSEFPATDNEIVDGVGYMRYYTGKTFDRLANDGQATKVDGNVVYNTWQTVYGAARSTEQDVIQADFFDYIYSIATPSEFRIQYNSWFDEMMYISDESITKTFTEFDRELSKAEVRPLDSYVVDDGWVNYNQTVPTNADRIRRAGNTVNTEGFWAFNSKFPQELYPSSKLAAKFGSYFGVWVGPRGGYNFYGDIANIIQAAGKGSKAGGSIDVADRIYLKNFTEMACDWMERFKVNYWKWDGFADNAQYGHFGSAQDGVARYSESNHHMIGGYQNMYHVTDLWEGWIDLMEAVRQCGEENEIYRLWISLTCYVNPSPWYLQWANSVWIQCTADQANTGPSASHMDRQMTYRDAVYYDFLKNHEFQFPLKNLYNHDPVYGVEGTGMHINTATTEQFQNYLYMLATRGTAFWELYFSDSIMTDEKYAVVGEFLEWAEENHNMLSQAKMFGDSPATNTKLSGNGGGTNNTYGFACFDGVDGIMSLRNPSNTAKTITFVYDRNLGVKENTDGKYHIEHSYKFSGNEADKIGEFVYGEEYTITLQPDEVRIFRVSENGDTVAPKIVRANTNGSNKITVKFDEKVTGTSFTVNGAPVAATVNDDDVSFTLELANPIPEGDVEVVAVDVKDLAGNACVENTKTIKQNLGKVVVNANATDLTGAASIADADDSLSTNAGFSVKVDVNTTTTGALVTQDGAFELGIDADGHAYFTVNGATATSEIVVNNGELHTIVGVLENNGMAKIYIDGNVDGAGYNAANRYFETPQAEIVLGNANFAGTLGAKVADEAAGYDNLALNFGVTAREPINPENFTIDVTSIDSENNADPEADPTIIFDGNDQTFWTSAAQESGLDNTTNMVINLNGTYKIDRVDYTKRFDAGQIFKCTGNLNDIVVEVSMDGETWTEVAAQATFDDEAYVAKGDGGTTEISFVPTDASYVRIWANDSYFWDTNSEKEYMTIADLKFYGVSLNPENVALNKVPAIKYGDGSAAPVNGDRPEAMATDGNIATNLGNYCDFGADGDVAGTTSIYLEVDLGANYSINKANLWRYWGDGRTYKATVIAISETADFANPTIVYNADANNIHGLGAGTDAEYSETSAGKEFTFDAVNGRYVRLYQSGSNKGNTNHVVEFEVYGVAAPSSSVDMSALEAKLAEAEAVKTTGYTEASVKVLTDAIAAAKILVARLDATEAEVAAMITRLDDAINGLELPGLNEDNLINKAANEATVDSYSSQCGTGGPSENGTGEAFATVDYNPATYWHSNWQSNNGEKHTITYDLGAEYTISDVTFLPRQEGRNGDIHKFEVYVGNNKDYTQNALTGEYVFATSGTLDSTKWYRAYVAGNGEFTGQYVTIRVTGSYGDSGNNKFASMSEIRFYSANEIVEPEPTVNKDALIEAIDNATAAYENEAGYTPETYQVFKAMYEYAVMVRDNADAAQAEVDLATATLVEKFQALVEVELPDAADKAALNALIAEVEALAEADYSKRSWSNLQAVLTAAKEVAANKAATQDEVDAAAANLTAKKEALVDISALNEAIVAAKAKLAEADKYTEESVSALQNLLATAEYVVGTTIGYYQEDADMHTTNLNNAIAALEEKAPAVTVDKAALNEAIAAAEALAEADYSRKSWSNLQTALTAAKDVAADANATQEVVDQAKAGLEAKQAALVNVVAAKEAIAAAEAKLAEADKYTDETVADLTTAYNNAVYAINSNIGYVQADADMHANNVLNAIAALVEKPVEPELTAPAKVENIVAEDTNYKTITLTWDASETATAYDVYRKAYDSEEFKLYKTVEDTTVAVTGVMTGKEYAFYVVAKNEAGVAEASETVAKATTLHGKVTLDIEQVSTSTFKLSWNKIDGATRYIVYRKRDDDKMKKVLTLGADKLEYLTAEMPNGEYEFQVRAGRYDSKDRVMTGASNKETVTVEKVAPAVTLKAGTKSIKVSWKKVEGVTHYQVYRATSKDGKYTKLITTKELSYTAKSLSSGKKYFFKVRGYKTYKSGEEIKYSVYTPYSAIKYATAK